MTTAISLWLVIGGAIALYVRWAVHAVANGANPWWYVAGAPLLYLAVLCSFTLLWFALAWIFRARRARTRCASDRRDLRLFTSTRCARSPGTAGTWRSIAGCRADPPPAPARAPVLLLHGVLCNRGSMDDLRSELVRAPAFIPCTQ